MQQEGMTKLPRANRIYGTGNIPHPRKTYAKRIEFYQYRRSATNPTWDARFNVEGQWTGWLSLGTETFDDAVDLAVDRLGEREHAIKAGLKIEGRKRREQNTVAEIALTTLARLAAERAYILRTQPAKKCGNIDIKVSRIKAIILPGIGHRGIANLTEADMEALRDGHKIGGPDGHAAKRSTIANLNSAWLEIVNDAVAAGFISKSVRKRLVISQEGLSKGERGSSFTEDEMRAVRAHMDDAWIAKGHTTVVRENRFLTRAIVSLMASTGITPGLEVETLTAGQIAEVKDTNGHLSLRITIRPEQGKRAKGRTVWARTHDVWPVVEEMRRLQAWQAANVTEEGRARNKAQHLFARPSDGRFPIYPVIIAEILDVLGMRVDPATGVNRRAYSCRHYYATQSLYDGVDIGALASNMGSSLRMIDDHYGHVFADRQSGRLTGSGKGQGVWLRQNGGLTQMLHEQENDPDY